VRVESIRAAIQVGDVARDHLFVSPREMAFGKVDRVGELHYVAKEIRALTEAFQDSRHLRAAGLGAPLVIGDRSIAGRLGVLDQFDLWAELRDCLNVVRHQRFFVVARFVVAHSRCLLAQGVIFPMAT
jgi:hypothetical protein